MPRLNKSQDTIMSAIKDFGSMTIHLSNRRLLTAAAKLEQAGFVKVTALSKGSCKITLNKEDYKRIFTNGAFEIVLKNKEIWTTPLQWTV